MNEAAVDLLADGRVEVVARTMRRVVAEVEGRTGERRTVRHDGGGWRCSCPCFHHRHECAHLDAVKLVCAEPGFRRLQPEGPSTRPHQQMVLEQ